MIDAKIVVVDDNKSVLSALEILLQFEFSDVQCLPNPNQLSSYADLDKVDIILLDMNFTATINTGNEGMFWLKEIKKKSPHTSVIMMTAFGEVDLAVRALKEGASDFILKPWNNERLLTTVKSAFDLRQSKLQIHQLKKKEEHLKQVINDENYHIIGESPALQAVLKLVRKVAKTDVNVLITGENGTGKELIAREIHRLSPRNDEVFIGVDLGSIAENLFESELFGHNKGAFTDAKEDRTGKFEAAHQGSLFLDEIGNLSLPTQAKLLTAIQKKSIVRVGSNKPLEVDIRLICATNSNLEKMVEEGLFREDLLYRINTIHVEVPPLRERKDDILLLADFFLKRFAKKYDKPGLRINKMAQDKLQEYSWPGNIREMQHTMERAVILCEGDVLGGEDFLLSAKGREQQAKDIKTLEEMEREMINKALQEHQGNYSAAAEQLGVSRQTLYNKMKRMSQDGQ
jgi:DNA-binding NtrC family response regulator